MPEILATNYNRSTTMLLIAGTTCIIAWCIYRRRCHQLSRNAENLIRKHSLCFERLMELLLLNNLPFGSLLVVIDVTADWEPAIQVPGNFVSICIKGLNRFEAPTDGIQDWGLVSVSEGESVINVLQKVGVNLDIHNRNGKTILHMETEDENSKPVVILLWELGFKIVANNGKGTAVWEVVEADKKAILKILWELRARTG